MNWHGFRQGHVEESKNSWLRRTGSTAQENNHPQRSTRSPQWPITWKLRLWPKVMSMLSLLFPGELSVMGFSGRQLLWKVTESNAAIWMGGHSRMLKPANCWTLAGGLCWWLRFCFVYSRVNWHANKSQDITGPMIALFPVLFLSLARRSERSPSNMPNWTCFICPSFRSCLVSFKSMSWFRHDPPDFLPTSKSR